MIRQKILLLLISSLVLISCNSEPQESKIPDDVSYSIINSDIVTGEKRGLEVRLNKKVSEDVLRGIAFDLKSEDSREFKRTLIGYYLPDMEPGEGAWATTHFNPDLEVKILGLSKENEENLTSEDENNGEKVVGRWLDEGFSSSRLVLIHKDDNLFMEQTYEDGSSRTMKVIEKESSLGRRIERVDSDLGDFWIINSNGNLEIRDDEGIIRTAQKID